MKCVNKLFAIVNNNIELIVDIKSMSKSQSISHVVIACNVNINIIIY